MTTYKHWFLEVFALTHILRDNTFIILSSIVLDDIEIDLNIKNFVHITETFILPWSTAIYKIIELEFTWNAIHLLIWFSFTKWFDYNVPFSIIAFEILEENILIH